MNQEVDDPKVIANRLLTRAWNRDGLPEIGAGLLFLYCSGMIYAMEVLPRRSAGQVAAVLAFALGFPVMGLGLKPLLKRARNRWLVEREGFVEGLRASRKQYLWPLAAMVVVLPSIMFITQHSERSLLPITGLLGALIAGANGWRGRLPRFVAGGVIMLATSVGLALSSVPVNIGMAVLFGSQGLLWLIAGGVVFARFLTEPAEGPDER
jgi:hypothetical protein